MKAALRLGLRVLPIAIGAWIGSAIWRERWEAAAAAGVAGLGWALFSACVLR